MSRTVVDLFDRFNRGRGAQAADAAEPEIVWLRAALARAHALLDAGVLGHTDHTWADRERLLREHRERLGVGEPERPR